MLEEAHVDSYHKCDLSMALRDIRGVLLGLSVTFHALPRNQGSACFAHLGGIEETFRGVFSWSFLTLMIGLIAPKKNSSTWRPALLTHLMFNKITTEFCHETEEPPPTRCAREADLTQSRPPPPRITFNPTSIQPLKPHC